MTNSRARTRELERHGTATIRALSAKVDAEYRASRLKVGGRAVPYATPYLSTDFSIVSRDRSRGISDCMAARLAYGDPQVHQSYRLESALGRVVFDILEQIRCESQVPAYLAGVHGNLDHVFLQWCQDSRSNGLVESSIGILLYTLIHMVRARLIKNADDEEVEALIEATRANLAPMIGTPFYQLSKTKSSAEAFAPHAVEIAKIIAQLADDETEEDTEITTKLAKHVIALGPDWDSQDVDASADGAGGIGGGASSVNEEGLDSAGDYCVFTREFDAVQTGESLYRKSQLETLRHSLNNQVSSQAISVTRLALRLQRLFAQPQTDGWLFGQDEGLIDGRRLSQLISNPDYQQIFLKDKKQLVSNTVVSFLIDNSGSMKVQRFEAVAVLVDTYVRALELAGIRSEVLGFTTGDWNGGRAMKEWRRRGMPSAPGRLNETLHLVYKDADTPWKRARLSIAALLKPYHFREGVDGEALIWAYRRLQARAEPRRVLVVISDGAPLDAATYNANREGFLTDHLRSVAGFLEHSPSIEVGAIGIDLDLSDLYAKSLSIDLSGTLNTRSYAALETLFHRK